MTFEITFTDINSARSWTAVLTPFASQVEADEYARKVCRMEARMGNYVIADRAVARPGHEEDRP